MLVALAIVGSACTSNTEPPETTTSTTEPAPVTTLDPGTTSTSTTTVPPTTTTTTEPPPTNECVVGPTGDETNPQGCTVLGIPLKAGEGVPPAALDAEADRVFHMLEFRPDLMAALLETAIEGRVVPSGTRIDRMPEFTKLYDLYPGTDWRRRGRSFPGTAELPLFAGGEENLLCYDDDFYGGEDIFVRTFALTIRRFGLDVVDPATAAAIDRAYGKAIAAGLWANTLAEINRDEYWMEGTQSFFDVNIEDNAADREPNSEHNHVNTRDELREYDPTLYAIAAAVYGETDWRPTCP